MNNAIKKKRILMLAPHSFPVTGAEAIVNINLLRVLTQSGEFEIDLISRKRYTIYPSASLDSYGVTLKSINIIKTNRILSIQTIWLLVRAFFHFGFISRECLWAEKAMNITEKKVLTNEYDYVLTKNNPSFLLGWYLKKKYGLKWVASWNDPFPFSKNPFPYSNRIVCRRWLVERRIIKMMQSADVHIFPCDRLKRYMQGYLKVDEEKCLTVAHVCSFSVPRKQKTSDGILRMIHSGNLFSPRNPDLFLRALASVLNKNPDFKIHLTLLGRLQPDIDKMIEQYGLKDYVKVIPSIEYKKCLQLMADYDVAVIVEAPVKEGIFLPTKVGEYVNMGIPVFAISPDVGTLNDLFQQQVIGYFASVNSVDRIEEEICKIYRDFERNDLKMSRAEIPYSNPSYIIEQYKNL